MRLFLLLLIVLFSSGDLVSCKTPPRDFENRRRQQNEIGISKHRTAGGLVQCKHCFLGRVFSSFVKTDPQDVDRIDTKFDSHEVYENILVPTNMNKESMDGWPMDAPLDRPLARTKRNCWYEIVSSYSGKPTFTLRCNKEDKTNVVSMTTQTAPTTETNTGSKFATKLLRMLGYEIYAKPVHEDPALPPQELTVKSKTSSESTHGRKLTSAERKHAENPTEKKNAKKKERRRKNKSNRNRKTSAEQKRAKKRKTKKRRKIHHGKNYPVAGGTSKEISSIWSSVIEPLSTVRARRMPTQAPLTTARSTVERPATKWWTKYNWLFNISVIITDPDGRHWYFPTVDKNPPTAVPLTAAPMTTQSSNGEVTNIVTSATKQFLFTMQRPVLPTLGHETVSRATTTLQNSTVDQGLNPEAFPAYATRRPLHGGDNPVLPVSGTPSHKWFPGQNRPTHRWYGHDARPTEAHTWFTDKKGGSEKDIHTWFGKQTIKPVTSHNWFPDAGKRGGSHKWFGQGDGTAPEDRTYWWWGSAYRDYFLTDEMFESPPKIPEKLLQKLFKVIRIATYRNER